jgi:hypothetical protein
MNLFNIFEGLWRGGEPEPIDYQGWRYVPELLVDVDVTKKVHHVFDPSGRELLGKENPFDSADSRMYGPYGTWASESEFKKFVDSQETKKPKPSLPVPVAPAGTELEEEPEPVKTASKNRFDPTQPVEAYGYVYDRRDQRQHWSKTFPNEAALDLWVRRNNATVIGMLNTEEAGVPPTEEYAIYADGRMIKKAPNQADAERALLKIQHEHPGKDFEIRRRSMVLTSALAEAARVGNVYRDDVPGTYGDAIADKQYAESDGKNQDDPNKILPMADYTKYSTDSLMQMLKLLNGDPKREKMALAVSKEILHRTKDVAEGDVIRTKFATKQAQRGRDQYHKVEGIDIPVFDREVGRALPPNLAKDPVPFESFYVKPGKTTFQIMGILPNGEEYGTGTTGSKELANALADAYNRGGFTDTDLKRVPVKGYDESTDPITKRYVLYLNDKPAAHYASKSEAESQAAMVLAKHPNTKYKILSKKQGMLESNNKGKNMRLKELTEGISSQDLGNVLFDRLEHRFPDIVAQHGHEVVADAVMHVAEFHAGAEELGSSDISIMLKQVLEYIKERQ